MFSKQKFYNCDADLMNNGTLVLQFGNVGFKEASTWVNEIAVKSGQQVGMISERGYISIIAKSEPKTVRSIIIESLPGLNHLINMHLLQKWGLDFICGMSSDRIHVSEDDVNMYKSLDEHSPLKLLYPVKDTSGVPKRHSDEQEENNSALKRRKY